MKKIITAILLAALAFSSCKNSGSAGESSTPKTLVIGMVETEKIDQIRDVREQIRKYLEKKLGRRCGPKKCTWQKCRLLLM